MPQFSPLWFIHTISWAFALLAILVYIHQAVTFPAMVQLQLSRNLLNIDSLSYSLTDSSISE